MSAILARGNLSSSESTSPHLSSQAGSSKTSDRFKVVSSKDGLTLLEEVESGRLVFERTYSLGSSDVDAFSAETYLASRVDAQGTSELTLRVLSFEVQVSTTTAATATATSSTAVEKRSGVVRYEAFAQTLSKEFVEHVKNSWRWRERELVNTMRCALGGLRELHVAGLTHGDLRMNSIVLSEGNSVKLADQFAINFNTISAPKSLRKDSKMLIATCAFLPPECIEECTESDVGDNIQAGGARTRRIMTMTPAADLWALGVILLEMMLLENVHSLVYDYSNSRIKRGVLETKIIKAKSFFSRKSKLISLLETLLSEQSTKRLEAYKFIEEMEQASMTMKSVSFNESSIVKTANNIVGAANEKKTKKPTTTTTTTKGKAKSNKKKEDSCETSLAQSQTREIEDSDSILSNQESIEKGVIAETIVVEAVDADRRSETSLVKNEEKWKLPYLDDDEFLDALLQRQVKNSSRFNHFYAQICDDNSMIPIVDESDTNIIPCIGDASVAVLVETDAAAALTSATVLNSQIVVPSIIKSSSHDVLSMRVETQESERSELGNRTLNAVDERLFLADDISSIASVGPQQVVNTFGLVVQDSQCCTSSSSSNTSKLDINSIRTLGRDIDEHSFEMISIPPLDEEEIYCKKQGIEKLPAFFSQGQSRNFTKGNMQIATQNVKENDENVDLSNVLREKVISNSNVTTSGMFTKEEVKDQKRLVGLYPVSQNAPGEQRGILLLGKSTGWKKNRIDVSDEKENRPMSRQFAGTGMGVGDVVVDEKAKILDELCGQALERSMRNREKFNSISSMSTSQLMKQSLSSARELGGSSSSSSSNNSSRYGTDESLQEVVRSRFNQGKSLKELEEELNSQLRMRENPFSNSFALASRVRSSVGSPEMHSQEENLRLSAHFGQLALTHLVEYISQQQQEMESLQSSSLSHRRNQREGGELEGDKSIESIQSSKQGLVVAGVSQLLKRQSQQQQQQQRNSFVVDHSLYDRALQNHQSMSKCSSNSRLTSNKETGFDCFHEANMTAQSDLDSITSLVSGFQQKHPPKLINHQQFNSSHALLGQKKHFQLNKLSDQAISIPQSDPSTQKRNKIQLLGTGSISNTASSFKRIL